VSDKSHTKIMFPEAPNDADRFLHIKLIV